MGLNDRPVRRTLGPPVTGFIPCHGLPLSRSEVPPDGDTEVTLRRALCEVPQQIAVFPRTLVDVTGIEPVTPCLQSPTIASNSSVRFL
jgi:hypothetical protein